MINFVLYLLTIQTPIILNYKKLKAFHNLKYMLCKIYKITSNNTNKIYIGSTIKSLQERFKGHIRDYKNFCKFWFENDDNGNPNCCSSRKILRYGDYNIEMIDEFTYQTKEDINLREQFYINLYSEICVNESKAFSDYTYKYKHGINIKIQKNNRLDNYFCINCNTKGHDASWINCCNNYNIYKPDIREKILNEIRCFK
jgi:hypothetical protein